MQPQFALKQRRDSTAELNIMNLSLNDTIPRSLETSLDTDLLDAPQQNITEHPKETQICIKQSSHIHDMIITHQGATFGVLQSVVCKQSTVIKNGIKKSSTKDSLPIYQMPDELEHHCVQGFIRYLYVGDYSDAPSTSEFQLPLISIQLNKHLLVEVEEEIAHESLTSTTPITFETLSRRKIRAAKRKLERELELYTPASIDTEDVLMDAEVSDPTVTHVLMFNVQMYLLAVRFEVGELKELAIRKYKACLGWHWNAAEFVQSVHALAQRKPVEDIDIMTDIMAVIAARRFHLLMKADEGFAELLELHPRFAVKVLRAAYRSRNDDIGAERNLRGRLCRLLGSVVDLVGSRLPFLQNDDKAVIEVLERDLDLAKALVCDLEGMGLAAKHIV